MILINKLLSMWIRISFKLKSLQLMCKIRLINLKILQLKAQK